MKKIIFIIIIIFNINCKGNLSKQNSQTSILENYSIEQSLKQDSIRYSEAKELDGLYEFKIGKTRTKDLKFIAQKIKKLNPSEFSYMSPISEQKSEKLLSDGIWCDDIKMYTVWSFNIENIEIPSLDLMFFRDLLIRIECYPDDELKEAFTYKYGSGLIEKKDPIIIKNSKNQNIIESFEEIIWENKNIKAKSYQYFYEYLDGQEVSSKFTIETKDLNIWQGIHDCNRKYRISLEQEEERKKENAYSKL